MAFLLAINDRIGSTPSTSSSEWMSETTFASCRMNTAARSVDTHATCAMAQLDQEEEEPCTDPELPHPTRRIAIRGPSHPKKNRSLSGHSLVPPSDGLVALPRREAHEGSRSGWQRTLFPSSLLCVIPTPRRLPKNRQAARLARAKGRQQQQDRRTESTTKRVSLAVPATFGRVRTELGVFVFAVVFHVYI